MLPYLEPQCRGPGAPRLYEGRAKADHIVLLEEAAAYDEFRKDTEFDVLWDNEVTNQHNEFSLEVLRTAAKKIDDEGAEPAFEHILSNYVHKPTSSGSNSPNPADFTQEVYDLSLIHI